jgi:hypothetical protein
MSAAHLQAALLAAVVLLTFCGPAAADDRDTTWVMTFDHDFYNWATPHVQTFAFPPSGAWSEILLFYTIECPEAPGDCDPWDRLGHVRVISHDSTGAEVHYEIARIVTPYDITGSGYPGSCTWIIDVSDYETLLRDSVTLRSYIETWIGGDRGWIVTIRFAFIPGETELEPYQITNLWTYDYLVFGDPARPIEDYLVPVEVSLDPQAVAFKVVATVTGHGQGNTDNAAEFARKWHEIRVGETIYGHYLWRPNCAANECSPQGGTWSLPRAGWCPGKDVRPWGVDITSAVSPGAVATLDYNIEAYENLCRPDNPECRDGVTCGDCDYNSTGHTEPNFCFNAQLIQYCLGPSHVAPGPPGTPETVSVGMGRPNPFVHATAIPYALATGGGITIAIHGPDGRLVRELSRRHATGGAFTCAWDGMDGAGQPAPAGIYFYTVRFSDGVGGSGSTGGPRRLIRLR